MKETFRIRILRPENVLYCFRYAKALSRAHMVTNLDRQLREGKITGWRIYDYGARDDWDWENDSEQGVME